MCAAKQIMEKLGGHKPVQMIERLFMPTVRGLKPTKGPSISFWLRELDGTVRKVEQRFQSGDDVPSCDKCQQALPAMYCKNDCG